MLLGLTPEGHDEYIGWYNLSLRELFSYTWAINVDYFFTIDSALMVASKGGFDINILNRMGIITKKNYLDSLQSVLKIMYGSGEKDETTEEGME
jgi:hypothetical protein